MLKAPRQRRYYTKPVFCSRGLPDFNWRQDNYTKETCFVLKPSWGGGKRRLKVLYNCLLWVLYSFCCQLSSRRGTHKHKRGEGPLQARVGSRGSQPRPVWDPRFAAVGFTFCGRLLTVRTDRDTAPLPFTCSDRATETKADSRNRATKGQKTPTLCALPPWGNGKGGNKKRDLSP